MLKSVFFFQAGFVRHKFCPGEAEQSAYDGSCDDVGGCCNGTLQEDLVGGFAVDQDIEHRCDNDPSGSMCDDLRDVEIDCALFAELTPGKTGAVSEKTYQETEDGGGNDPAPPDAPACAESDQEMSDQSDQAAAMVLTSTLQRLLFFRFIIYLPFHNDLI